MIELTPVQAMLLEVYRVHRKYGYAGDAGKVKHFPSSCRKCYLLCKFPEAFEEILPFELVRRLVPVGHSEKPVQD